jgi:hypothetical protein
MSEPLTDEERFQAAYDAIMAEAQTAPQVQPPNSLLKDHGDGQILCTVADALKAMTSSPNRKPMKTTDQEMTLWFAPGTLSAGTREFSFPAGTVIKLLRKHSPCTLVLSHEDLHMTLVKNGGKQVPWLLDRVSGFKSTGRGMVGKAIGARANRSH